jgi:hypothetical protein
MINTSSQDPTRDISKFLKYQRKNDIVTKENILSDKFIYAKGGIYIKQFNSDYDLYAEGNCKIIGSLEIDGNLVLNKGIEIKDKNNFITLSRNDKNITGLILDQHIINNESTGFFYKKNQDQFIIGKLLKDDSIKNESLQLKNLSCEKISIFGNELISKDNSIICCSNLQINGIFQINNATINSSENNIIIGNLKCKNIISEENKFINLDSQNIKTDNLEITNGSCDTFDINTLKISDQIIFDDASKIIFNDITTIDKLSCSYINKKLVNNDGEIVTTDGAQILQNKIFKNNVSFDMNRIINVAKPINNNDAVNKEYVDNLACGITYIEPIRVSSIQQLEAVFFKMQKQFISELPGKIVIDNFSELNVGDRVLVKNQQNEEENGIYVVCSCGNEEQQWILVLDNEYEQYCLKKQKICLGTYCQNGEKNEGITFSLSNNLKNNITINSINNSDKLFDKIKILEEKIRILETK